MIAKFIEFINENKGIDLSYYAFDIDDNLFHMPTVIHMDKKIQNKWIPTDVSTSEFAEIRGDKENWRLINDNPIEAFSEFSDIGKRGNKAFIEDMKAAIFKGEYGPSWDAFIECLTSGSIFALITARGNEPSTYRSAVEYLIDNILSDDQKSEMYNNCLRHAYLFNTKEVFSRVPNLNNISSSNLIKLYLDNCDYYGVSSPSFKKEFGLGDASNPELAKEMALKRFIDKINNFGKTIGAKSVSIGFSDDDLKNVNHVEKIFRNELSLTHALKYNIYNTNDRTIKGGKRIKIESSLISNESNSAPGMESSILPFTKFNNMTNRLYPSDPSTRQDDFQNKRRREIEYLSTDQSISDSKEKIKSRSKKIKK